MERRAHRKRGRGGRWREGWRSREAEEKDGERGRQKRKMGERERKKNEGGTGEREREGEGAGERKRERVMLTRAN